MSDSYFYNGCLFHMQTLNLLFCWFWFKVNIVRSLQVAPPVGRWTRETLLCPIAVVTFYHSFIQPVHFEMIPDTRSIRQLPLSHFFANPTVLLIWCSHLMYMMNLWLIIVIIKQEIDGCLIGACGGFLFLVEIMTGNFEQYFMYLKVFRDGFSCGANSLWLNQSIWILKYNNCTSHEYSPGYVLCLFCSPWNDSK